jgi:putative oxidoreductase
MPAIELVIATIAIIVGRSLLASLFSLAGAAKIAGPRPFLDHMAAHHVPGCCCRW